MYSMKLCGSTSVGLVLFVLTLQFPLFACLQQHDEAEDRQVGHERIAYDPILDLKWVAATDSVFARVEKVVTIEESVCINVAAGRLRRDSAILQSMTFRMLLERGRRLFPTVERDSTSTMTPIKEIRFGELGRDQRQRLNTDIMAAEYHAYWLGVGHYQFTGDTATLKDETIGKLIEEGLANRDKFRQEVQNGIGKTKIEIEEK